MTELTAQTCEACRADAPRVTDEELGTLVREVPDWRVEEHGNIKQLARDYAFSNFRKALDFSNAVGELAEQEGHHPAILTEWGKVNVRWWSHEIRGLHRNDFICAAKTDAIAHQHPTK